MKQNLIYEIGHDDNGYFVYESVGLRPIVYRGSYTQCLVVLGGTSKGDKLEDVISLANELQHKPNPTV